MNERMNEWMNERMNEWMNEWMHVVMQVADRYVKYKSNNDKAYIKTYNKSCNK